MVFFQKMYFCFFRIKIICSMKFIANCIFAITFLLVANTIPAQTPQFTGEKNPASTTHESLPFLTWQDSVRQLNIPCLTLPEHYHNRPLPECVDNSQQPFFRPILTQTSVECSQTMGVAYTFTYEINRLRNIPSDIPENQYPTHFAFNWGNQGVGAACSFFDSWDIIRAVGTPTISEYGGTASFGGEKRWMNGYDLYYSAMKNRIWEYFSISLKDEEGLLTLKHWINDHLDGSETGGIASIYCAYSTLNDQLPPGTPEAGKFVIPELENPSNHAVCIVGYHDSIRWDYNNDGQFTNHLDINNDGIVDFKDWEIGGVKIANSYPITWGDFGFSYLTYNALCRKMAENGVWNQCANVVSAKANTDPKITYKITLTHDKRCNIKVMAGISSQPGATEPEYILGFPVFNYQGGPFYMQGGTTEEDKTLEFGLDVTPLLGFVEPGTEAAFFLMVDEDDPGNSGTGLVNSWSLMNYTNGLTEIPGNGLNVPLVENGLTVLSLDATIGFVAPQITDQTLPPATVYEPFEHQMTGNQGAEPYRWWLNQNYEHSYSTQDFPEITAEELFPNGTNSGYASKGIDFDFPFYGSTYNTFYIHTDGYLMFEENEMPWIFVIDDLNLMKNLRCIAPYMAKILTAEGGNIWYEGDAEKATFRWKAIENGTGNVVNFAVSLFPSGKIEFYYGEIDFAPWNKWFAGISNGDGYNALVLDISNNLNLDPDLMATLQPQFNLTGMTLSREGLFCVTPSETYDQVPVSFYIQDADGLCNIKTLSFSTDKANNIVISRVEIAAGNDSIIEFDENVSLTVELKNMTTDTIDAGLMNIALTSGFINLTDSTLGLAPFTPGETKTYPDAFGFQVSTDVPDNYPLGFSTKITTTTENYDSHLHLKAFSPVISVAGYSLTDGNNNYPEPGDVVSLSVHIKNDGGARIDDLYASLQGSNPGVEIIIGETNIATIAAYHSQDAVFTFAIDSGAQAGFTILLDVEIVANSGFSASRTIAIDVGNLLENAETGNFDRLNWLFLGEAPWQTDSQNPFEGSWCFRSGAISHNRFSELRVAMNVVSDSEIRFFSRVSSQQDADYLFFSIDGVTTGVWSGEAGWADHVFPVMAGQRTFSWKYTKDYAISEGSDCAWLDYIVFPPCTQEEPAITAGADIDICIGQDALPAANVFLAEPLVWTTSGDGTFNPEGSLNPVYTPGGQDLANGSAVLTFNALCPAGDTLSDDLSVFIHHLPLVFAGNDTTICASQNIINLSGMAQDVSFVLWITTGDGWFEDPNITTTQYFPGQDDILRGTVLLTLVGFPISPCETGMNHSLLVTLLPLPTVTFDTIATVCNTAQPFKLTQGQPAGGVYSGPSVTEGWFYPSQAGVGAYLVSYIFTNTAGCSDTAFRQITVTDCTGIESLTENNLLITPNPGKGVFVVRGLMFSDEKYRLEVYNATGNRLLKSIFQPDNQSFAEIDLSVFPDGLYWVKLVGSKNVLTGKIVLCR